MSMDDAGDFGSRGCRRCGRAMMSFSTIVSMGLGVRGKERESERERERERETEWLEKYLVYFWNCRWLEISG